MKVFKQFLLAAALAAGAASPFAHAQAANDLTAGEVRKLGGNRITLKHEEIKNLGMPPMAMEFQVKHAKLLEKLKVGDKVRFRAVFVEGKYFVTEIKPAK